MRPPENVRRRWRAAKMLRKAEYYVWMASDGQTVYPVGGAPSSLRDILLAIAELADELERGT